MTSTVVTSTTVEVDEAAATAAERPRQCKHCGKLVAGGHAERVNHRNECTKRPTLESQPGVDADAPGSQQRVHTVVPSEISKSSSAKKSVPSLNFQSCKYCGKLFSLGAAISTDGAAATHPHDAASAQSPRSALAAHEAECVKRLPAGHRLRIGQRLKDQRRKEREQLADDSVARRPRTTSPTAASSRGLLDQECGAVSPIPKARQDDDTRSLFSVASTMTASGLTWTVPAAQKCVTPNLAAYDRSMDALLQRVLPPIEKIKSEAKAKRNQWGRCKFCHKRVVNYLLKQHESTSCIVGAIMAKIDRIGELLAANDRLNELERQERRESARAREMTAAQRARHLRKSSMKRRASSKQLNASKEQSLMRTQSVLSSGRSGAAGGDADALPQSTASPRVNDSGRTSPVEGAICLRSGILSPRQFAFLPERDAILEEARHCIAVIDAVVPIKHIFMERLKPALNDRVLDPRSIDPSLDDIAEAYGRIIRLVTQWMESFTQPPKSRAPKDEKSDRKSSGHNAAGDSESDNYSDDFENDDNPASGREQQQHHSSRSHASSATPSLGTALHNPKLHRSLDEERKSKQALRHAAFLAQTKTSDYLGWEHEEERRKLYGDLLPPPLKPILKGSARDVEKATTTPQAPVVGPDGIISQTTGRKCRFDEETLRLARAVCDGQVTLSEALQEATENDKKKKRQQKKLGVWAEAINPEIRH